MNKMVILNILVKIGVVTLKIHIFFCNYEQFNMESINNVIKLTQPNIYMTFIELKDAFFSELVHTSHQKYFSLLIFQMDMDIQWEIIRYLLRSKRHSSAVYMNDLYLKGETTMSLALIMLLILPNH